jgi:UDP-N-acetylmuramoylalanine--D-glutamate ligase
MNIGIIGFGIVGKSYLSFLSQNGFRHLKQNQINIKIWDSRTFTEEESHLLKKSNVIQDKEILLKDFIEQSDFILPSPGIDMRPFEKTARDKIVVELDLFAERKRDYSIAITGSLGKTTVTGLIGSLIEDAEVCGNIGRPMLDVDVNAILELSSFQLEYSKRYKPNIALFTNLYPNHLNRHAGMEKYFDAKLKLFRQQDASCHAIFSHSLLTGDYSDIAVDRLSSFSSQRSFIATTRPTLEILQKQVLQDANLFFIEDEQLKRARIENGECRDEKILCDISHFTHTTFLENWLFAVAAAYLHGLSIETIIERAHKELSLIREHRLELCATINGVEYYNDSKATVIEATMAAVKKLAGNNRQTILILGGLRKGVDRSSLIRFVSDHSSIKKVLAFGPGARDFKEAGIETFETLEDVVNAARREAEPGGQVLFSPSGASFDLFKNYMHRGDEFNKLLA